MVALVGRYSYRPDLQAGMRRLDGLAGSTVERDGSPAKTRRPRLQFRLAEQDRAALVRDYLNGTPTTKLTESYGLGKGSVLEILEAEGVKMRRQPLTDEQVAMALRLYAEGKSLAQVAKAIGSAPTSVGRALKTRGMRLRPGRRR